LRGFAGWCRVLPGSLLRDERGMRRGQSGKTKWLDRPRDDRGAVDAVAGSHPARIQVRVLHTCRAGWKAEAFVEQGR
jgi:hypothetical protein